MKYCVFICCLFLGELAFADVILPSMFSDHMVLQQQDQVRIWGWAAPNEDIVISPSWSNKTYKTKASNQAFWELKIETPKYGGPFQIKINGYNELVLKDVLIGEVWLCSGQSNMEMPASWGIKNGDQEIAAANHTNIRFFTAPKISAKNPQNNILTQWELCTPETMKKSSALAYFFATKIQENLKDVPVGLIVSAWGGTPAEIWMPENTITNNDTLKKAAEKLNSSKYGPIEPARAFNSMINPLIGYTISGVLWYQGESNGGSTVYDKTLEALITSWRRLWQKDFPFYLVQIAPYNYGDNHFGGVQIRDAQRRVSNNIPNTEMVVISDVSPIDDIHPKDKKSVGFRLADIALKKHYKVIDGLVESPNLSAITFKKNEAILAFQYADGLHQKNLKSLFEIAGEDHVFHSAKCKIKDQLITVSSKQVKTPKYVRFAWKNNSQSNIFNKANLPLSSFTTEN
ncbi:sialate O-acetylesterase [Tamlana sp. I1]|uniref:sialate O-acetylesterase n=1 Tax=Tamlana sp. I1 TaxID=2762061 RepID=UPI00188F04C4|nr:sialate O-acetylesterase [Tamlana sp. I1]